MSLLTKPSAHIEDVRVRTDLKNGCTEADLNIRVSLKGTGSVSVCLKEAATDGETLRLIPGETVLTGELEDAGETDGGEKILSGTFGVAAPALWSAESPQLYQLLLTVRGEDGETAEVMPVDVGFREFRMSEDHVMLLNGKRIVFNGVNRHEFGSRRGRASTEKEMLTDLLVMKRNNINALRMSHYPNQSAMYRFCDRLGIYVIDETNLETHGTWDAYVRGASLHPDLVVRKRIVRRQEPLRYFAVFQRLRRHAPGPLRGDLPRPQLSGHLGYGEPDVPVGQGNPRISE